MGQANLVSSDETLVHGVTRRTAAVSAEVYSRYIIEHGLFLIVESKDVMRELGLAADVLRSCWGRGAWSLELLLRSRNFILVHNYTMSWRGGIMSIGRDYSQPNGRNMIA